MDQHGRLPWPAPMDLAPPAKAVYAAITGGPRASGAQHFQIMDPSGRLEGPFNAMVIAPSVGGPLQELGAAIRYQTGLSDRQREVAILALAGAATSEFEWYAHKPIAQACGIDEKDIAAICAGREADGLDATEKVVLKATRQLVATRSLESALAGECQDHLGSSGFVELVVLVGYYQLLDLTLRVFQTPLPAGIGRQFNGGWNYGD